MNQDLGKLLRRFATHQFKTLLICASPRSNGTSAMLLERVSDITGGELHFIPRKGSLDKLVAKMQAAAAIVISGPCYVNTCPARLIELLETASMSGGFSTQKLYGIINGGMPYIHTHQHGMMLLQNFAKQNNLLWQGGFILGVGAMLDGQDLEKHIRQKTVVPAFNQFIEHIVAGTASPDSLYEEAQKPPGPLMTRIAAKFLTSMVIKNIKKHGHDPEAPNWYLRNKQF